MVLSLPAAFDVEIKLYNKNINRKSLFLLQIMIQKRSDREKKKRDRELNR